VGIPIVVFPSALFHGKH